MKITIYTQAYNTEKYISKCIESVLGQTYKDYEYVIIDNGSNDFTLEVIKKYASMDSRIRVIEYKENQRGLLQKNAEVFEGEYCTIIDSDDWWEYGYLERLIKFLEDNQLDLAVTGTQNFFEQDGSSRIMRKLDEPVILTQKQLAWQYPQYWIFPSTYWGNIMKTSILKSMIHEFEMLSYGGDTVNMLHYINHCNRIGIDNTVLYNYRIRDNSISYEYDRNRFASNVVLIDNVYDFLNKNNSVNEEIQSWLMLVYLNSVCMTVETLEKSTLSSNEKILELRKIIEYPLTKELLPVNCSESEQLKTILLDILLDNIDEQADCFDGILSIIAPKCACAVKIQCLQLIKQRKELFDAIVSDEPEKLLTQLLSMISANECVKQYNLGEMVQSLASDRLILKNINDIKFLKKYGDVYLTVWHGQYTSAIDQMSAILAEKENSVNETFIELYLTLAAMLQRTDEFLYGKFYSAKYYLRAKSYKKSREALNDLMEMGVEENEEINAIRQKLEAFGE